MIAKEALELWKERTLVTKKELILYGNYMTVLDNLECVNAITLALEELEAIKSADGGEAMRIINKMYNKDSHKYVTVGEINYLENFILKAKAKEKELTELKKTVKAFIDNYVAYPYDEDGVAYDDEYTKDYERLLNLCKGSEE